ncbi:transcription factor with AP2 domain(s), putative [Plasmodium knowlesi strain H]|uniref:Transcription factor with AP2 domain(S), putative n=3 Tax=Plasmodium knowlesi TaxID=5850 RepID=A0A5K1USE0_PLAKH|nr:AP2 domain transcription factor AP2-O3, putative [Plasmodium knowlesi strain H]OTN67647.1 putative AP2 family [Plasmodium knowlesi]CAA9990331.1 AP2 domain transcription factor AP2-O3, putative [Plasmodium knowlesi strain H]SBO19537.1 transcription factor with AP2 domain(s), putative [Plasmodium knowlesi strain H]SBO22763.1 transcription factor with AP2 domain(s), putative [Plasmodium knowlesi strain H]VVS79805.1 AP2 domain transcription factor AP2-O3, putative [Plasmodium knowlesi strain H]|eukprot:XP_002260731.1 AP2 family, putative [Plasmodium knowlesi strain H]
MATSLGNSDELLKELDLENYVTFVKRCFKNGIKKEEEDICAQDLRNLAKCLPRVSGVWYDLHKNSWEARWAEGTKSARKYYSVQKFGFHEARKLAIKTIKTKEINYIYNSINEDFNKPLKWNLNSEFLEMNHDPIINLKRKYRSPNCKVREKKIKKDPSSGNGVNRKNKNEQKYITQTRGLRRGHVHYTSPGSCDTSQKCRLHKSEEQHDNCRDAPNGLHTYGLTNDHEENNGKDNGKNGREDHSEASYIFEGNISKLRNDQKIDNVPSEHIVEGSLSSTCLNQKENYTKTEMALSKEGHFQHPVHMDECNGTCLSEEEPLSKENLCTVDEKENTLSSVNSLNGNINGMDDYHTSPMSTPSHSDKIEDNNSGKQCDDETPKVESILQKHTLRKKILNCNKDMNGKDKTSLVKYPRNKILSYMRQHKKTKNKSTLYIKQNGLLKMNLKQTTNKMFNREHGSTWNRRNLKKKNFLSEKRACINGGALFVKKIKSCNHTEGKKCKNCDLRKKQLKGLREHGSLLIPSVVPNGGETFNGGDSSNDGETFNGEESPNVDLTYQLGSSMASPTYGEMNTENGDEGDDQTSKQLDPLKKRTQKDDAKKENTQQECIQQDYTQKECIQQTYTQQEYTPSTEPAQKMKCRVEINLKEVIHSDTLSIFKNAINLLLNDLKCKCVPHLDKQFLNILEIIDNHISYVNSMLSEQILITYVHLFDICVSNNILPSQMDQSVQKVFCNALIAFHILLFNFLKDKRG